MKTCFIQKNKKYEQFCMVCKITQTTLCPYYVCPKNCFVYWKKNAKYIFNYVLGLNNENILKTQNIKNTNVAWCAKSR